MPKSTSKTAQKTITSVKSLSADIQQLVDIALTEDLGSGDITAELIPANKTATAKVITREDCTIAGKAWVDATFEALDTRQGTQTIIEWQVNDGEQVKANSVLFTLSGNARTLLTGERAALNFLQLLSGTATSCQSYADLVAHTQVHILDTRKTLPGLRSAQKYAVTQGNCHNHRIGLFDAFLIKENHIAACGGITQAIRTAQKNHPNKPVEVEVESLEELKVALEAKADIVMLDNFTLEELAEGVAYNQSLPETQRAKLEASGNVNKETLVPIAETGVDYISIGALTKDCKAIDLSMRIAM
ncbi:MAG: carboxylating nicotinate-nucleotide diphosphorylase [Cellvibrionaceae bacterium]